MPWIPGYKPKRNYQNAIFDALFEAGADLGLKPFGIRAMDSMRLEKSYKLIPRELSIEYAALESGLDRFISLKKGDFLGRAGLAVVDHQVGAGSLGQLGLFL